MSYKIRKTPVIADSVLSRSSRETSDVKVTKTEMKSAKKRKWIAPSLKNVSPRGSRSPRVSKPRKKQRVTTALVLENSEHNGEAEIVETFQSTTSHRGP